MPAASGGPTFPSFFSLVTQSGLGVVRSGDFDAPTLYRLARESVSCEEKVATGCFMVQAAALVHCWALMREQDPLQHEREVVQFGQLTAPAPIAGEQQKGCEAPAIRIRASPDCFAFCLSLRACRLCQCVSFTTNQPRRTSLLLLSLCRRSQQIQQRGRPPLHRLPPPPPPPPPPPLCSAAKRSGALRLR